MNHSRRHSRYRVLRLSIALGLPLLLLPLWSKKVSAKRPAGNAATRKSSSGDRGTPPRGERLQALLEECKSALEIPEDVLLTLVPENPLVVSVTKTKGPGRVFALSLEEPFIDALNDEELKAVMAHELGHVWIFTHHPYLHTEELANEIALRLVSRETLTRVYEKVWQRTGSRGQLRYLPDDAS
jgi:hypothetical protein